MSEAEVVREAKTDQVLDERKGSGEIGDLATE